MKRAIQTILLLLIVNIWSIGQIIKGKIVFKFVDSFEALPGITINLGSTYYISDINGYYCFNSLTSEVDSVSFSGSIFATIRIVNLPSIIDTLDLGTMEMIEHKIISQKQYDSIQNALIKTFDPDIIIVQRSKAGKILHKKYMPLNDWVTLIGYLVKDEISKNEMINPFDKGKKIIFEYDILHDLIYLDYNKLIE